MKEDILNELENIAPRLADLKRTQKQESFEMPKGYFEGLSDKIIAAAQAEDTAAPVLTVQKGGKNPIFRLSRWSVGVAAAVLITGAAFFMTRQNTPDLKLDNFSDAEIQAFIHENLDDFDEELILASVDKDEDFSLFELKEVQDAVATDTLKIPQKPQGTEGGGKTPEKNALPAPPLPQKQPLSLDDIPDEEIEKYLKSTFSDDDDDDSFLNLNN